MTSRNLAKALAFGVSTFVFLVTSSELTPASAIQCAPYARSISGIDLYGAAWTWWASANGRYERGNTPRIGSAIVFKKLKGMPSGHVAIVTAVESSRLIKVNHANWVHRGRQGKVETNVSIYDESPNNDWSQVRVWYSPVHDLGVKVYATYGFIYPMGVSSRVADKWRTSS
ncbi:MAG TPA: CHAP domain-containing protein [Alphaproteobacteria bacterium]|nr:CHAP domain-containing protein [Alphaproteobacteria bacterium]